MNNETYRFRVVVVNIETGELGLDTEIEAPCLRAPDGGAPEVSQLLGYGRIYARRHIMDLARKDSSYSQLRGPKWDIQVYPL